MKDSKVVNSSAQIKWGAIISYVVIAFNILSGLLYTPWLVNKIGQSSYGIYTLASTLIAFFTMDFGISDAIARFLCKYNAEGDKEKENDFLGISMKIYAVIDIIIFAVFVIAFIFADKIYTQLSIDELIKFRVIFAISGFYSLLSFPFMPLNGILVAHERFVFYRATELFNKVMTIATMIFVLLLDGGLYGLVIVNAVVGLLTIVLKVFYIKRNRLVHINLKAKNKNMLKSILSFSIWSCMLVIAQRFIFNIEPTILGALSGTAQIAIFSVASTIEGYTATLAGALDALFLPKVTRVCEGMEEQGDIQSLLVRVGRIQLMIVGILLMGLVMMGKEFMLLWMGLDYIDSYYVLILMIAVSLVILTQSIADTALIATDRIHLKAICALIAAIINVILSIVFVPKYGAIGAGIGIFAGSFIGNLVVKNIIYVKCLTIRLRDFFYECFVKLAPPLVIISIIMGIMQKYIVANNLLVFMVKVIIVCLIYVVVLWTGFMNIYEKQMVTNIIKSIKEKVKR